MSKALYYSTFSCDPFYNMAMDEWLFDCAVQNQASVFLRLYTWNAGAITIGVNQDASRAVAFEHLNGTPIIRRITGGRALYHEPSELTYSIAVNLEQLKDTDLTGSISKSSHLIAQGLLSFLNEVGLSAQIVRQSSPGVTYGLGSHKGHCFQSTARDEIIGEKGKVAASAQRRHGSAFLQHGSIKLAGVAGHPALSSGAENCTEVCDMQVLEKDVFQTIAKTFIEVMSIHLGVDFRTSNLNSHEEEILRFREGYVRKNYLQRRDPIEQIGEGVSL